MADEEQVERLKRGAGEWLQWYADTPHARVDLDRADLRQANLLFAPLHGVTLREAKFDEANLTKATFGAAALSNVSFKGACLAGVILISTRLTGCKFAEADFSDAWFGNTTIARSSLHTSRGLEATHHSGPSFIDIETLRRAKGTLPDKFLRGIGLADYEIVLSRLYDPSLSEHEITDILYEVAKLRGTSPIQTHPVFISYSHQDTEFVETLEKTLDQHGIRYWRDVHDLVAGRIESQIDRAMRLNPIVILVLSKNSVNSDWVEWEADKARELEKELGRDVLCPVALDDSWKNCKWSGPLRKQIEKYVVVNHKQLDKLIKGLGLHYR